MKAATGLERSLWVLLLVVLIVVPNLFAMRQFRAAGGYLFYTNAFDESTYLSYDGAMVTRSFTHMAEYLVVALHELGVSGGYTNLAFDVVWPVVTVVFLRQIAIALGFSALESIVYPFVIVALPVVLGYSNPYYSRLYNFNYNSRGLSWITLPQGYYPPFFRTPEPQLSLAVVALAVHLAIRWQSYIVALAVAPFVYPFVGIPYTFVVVALMLHARLSAATSSVRVCVAIVTSYVATSGMILAFFLLFVRRTTLAAFLPPTHLPLLSGTGAAAIVVYLLVRSRLDSRHRVPALFLAVAPTAVANTQLISGFVQAPHNLEQSFGVIAVAAVCVLAMKTAGRRSWTPLLAAAASCWLLAIYSSQVFAANASVLQRLPISKQLLDELKTEPESLVFDDPDLADIFSLVAPRTHNSALARSQTLPTPPGATGVPSAAERFQNYLCVRQLLSSAGPANAINPAAFAELDRGFRYLNQDFPLIHLNRKSEFTPVFDPTDQPRVCSPRTLRVFPAFVLGTEFGKPLTPWAVTTPPQRWAYASVVELLPATPAAPVEKRLVDVRITLTVARGCLSVGVLTPDQRSFVSQIAVIPAELPRAVDLLVEPAARPNWLVLSNCSAAGASSGSVQAVNMFHVESVTTRSVAAAMPERNRP
jgi:hypothetical protein